MNALVRLTLMLPPPLALAAAEVLSDEVAIPAFRIFQSECFSRFAVRTSGGVAHRDRMPWCVLWLLLERGCLDGVLASVRALVAPDELRWWIEPVLAQEGLA